MRRLLGRGTLGPVGLLETVTRLSARASPAQLQLVHHLLPIASSLHVALLRSPDSPTDPKLVRLLDLYADLPLDSGQPMYRLVGLGRGHQLVPRDEVDVVDRLVVKLFPDPFR